MKEACKISCPFQLECEQLLAKGVRLRSESYSLLLESLDWSEENLGIQDRSEFNTILRPAREELIERINQNDKEIDELQKLARRAGALCLFGPIKMKRFLIFGEEVVRCSSPV